MDLKHITILDADDVAKYAPYAELVDALATGHLGAEPAMRRLVYGPEGGSENFMALPAWFPGEAIGIKLVTIFPDNPSVGLPSVQALVLLFDGVTGEPVALIDGTELTYRKTACDSALGSRLLSRSDSSTFLMVGAGGLARHLIAAHRSVRSSIDRVLVWNRTRTHAERLVEELRVRLRTDTESDVTVEVVDDLEAAVGVSDIVCTATMAAEPLIRGRWVRPGTHLDLVGAYLPDRREVDDDVVLESEIFVDSRVSTLTEGGDLVIPIAAGLIDETAVLADLYELCRGTHPGRSGPDAITLFENGGGGHLDVMTARHIWAASKQS